MSDARDGPEATSCARLSAYEATEKYEEALADMCAVVTNGAHV